MRPKQLHVTLSVLCLAFIISGCFLQPLPLESVYVFVNNKGQLCPGGLKAQLVRSDRVVYESVTVPPDEFSQEGSGSFDNDVGASGITFDVRAFCYGTQGEEVGYAEQTVRLTSGSSGSAMLEVRPGDGSATGGCLIRKPRGKPPCIG